METALRALMSEDTPQKPEKLSREAQLRQFVRRQLRPMTAREELSDYVRIFGWETLKPTAVFRKFMAREAAPFLRRRDRACPPLPTEPRDTRAGGRRRVVAVRTMQHFRAQRGAAGRPAAAPQGGRTLCEPTCRDNNRLGRNRSGPIAGEGAVLNPIWRRPTARQSIACRLRSPSTRCRNHVAQRHFSLDLPRLARFPP